MCDSAGSTQSAVQSGIMQKAIRVVSVRAARACSVLDLAMSWSFFLFIFTQDLTAFTVWHL